MPCTRVTLAGVTAIVCTRGRRPRCVCGAAPVFQCDAPSKRRSGTCDRHLCASCATEVGPEKHLCPTHKLQAEEQQRREHEPSPMEPWQAGLF